MFVAYYFNRNMKREVIFDLETKKLFSDIQDDDPGKLGVSIVSMYIRELDESLNEIRGELKSFWEEEFGQIWEHFQTADRIIGFNTFGFDVPALAPYANFPFNKLKHFDIMDEVKKILGHRLSLNAIATQTLNAEKIDSGVNAVLYFQKGDKESLAKLKSYCEADVLITKDVYDHALAHKHLLYKDKWNTVRTVDLDFAYKVEESDDQIGLF